jgi:hypothetical protein
MLTYTTLDGDTLDLSGLSEAESRFLETLRSAFQANAAWESFNRLVHSSENPVLEPGTRVSRRVAENPLFRAAQDMEDRLGIRQGEVGAEALDLEFLRRDPFADEWLTIAQAAAMKGVTVQGVYKAIDRGELIATHERPARVSGNGLARWDVMEVRQAAGRVRIKPAGAIRA